MDLEKRLPIPLDGGLHLALAPIRRAEGQTRRLAEVDATRRLLSETLCHLGLRADAQIEHTASGAPRLTGLEQERAVSISHSEEWVAILLGAGGLSLGVDVERRGRQVERVEHKFASEEESALLDRLGADRLLGLQLLWSAKEALYKCLQPASGSFFEFELEGMTICPSNSSEAGHLPLEGTETTAEMRFRSLASQRSEQLITVKGWASAGHVLCYTSAQERV